MEYVNLAVIRSAQSFSELAGVMAGFALAAMILLIEPGLKARQQVEPSELHQKAIIFLSFTFYANIVVSVFWGVVGGIELEASNLPFILAFLASLVSALATAMTVQAVGFLLLTAHYHYILPLFRSVYYFAAFTTMAFVFNLGVELLLVQNNIRFEAALVIVPGKLVLLGLCAFVPVGISLIIYRRNSTSRMATSAENLRWFVYICLSSSVIVSIAFSVIFFREPRIYLPDPYLYVATVSCASLIGWASLLMPKTNSQKARIKGNRNTKIYHLPDGRYYSTVSKDVVYFDSVSEAEDAGYTQAQS